jgi:GR25 family glycosyltransferase involved in LPS biosynthesis
LNYSYLNLEHAKDRRANIEKCFHSASLIFNRIDAIYGKNAPFKIQGVSESQIGCYLTHMKALAVHTDSNDHLMILEDDSYFDESITIANELIEKFNSHWDIIYLDSTIVEVNDYLNLTTILYKNIHNTLSTSPFLHEIKPNQTLYGTHGYIINKKSKDKILSMLNEHLPIGKPIDNIYSINIRNNKLSAFIILPTLVTPSIDTSNSQISSNEHELMQDWIKFRNLISHKFYKENKVDLNTYFTKISNETSKIIFNRVNFSFYGEFLP